MSIVVDFIAGVGIDLDYAQRMMDGSGNAENRKQSKLHPSMSHRSIFFACIPIGKLHDHLCSANMRLRLIS